MSQLTLVAKQQLFFSSNHADENWRLKEKLVALVESYLRGTSDCLTFSPAFPKNSAGDEVEVDAAYSIVSKPDDLFEFVQVRDRDGAQGRPWIEQVLGQKQSLKFGSPICASCDG